MTDDQHMEQYFKLEARVAKQAQMIEDLDAWQDGIVGRLAKLEALHDAGNFMRPADHLLRTLTVDHSEPPPGWYVRQTGTTWYYGRLGAETARGYRNHYVEALVACWDEHDRKQAQPAEPKARTMGALVAEAIEHWHTGSLQWTLPKALMHACLEAQRLHNEELAAACERGEFYIGDTLECRALAKRIRDMRP